MESSKHKKSLLDPYRTIGNFISGKITLSQSQPISLTVPTNTSFKVYSDALAIKVASPPFATPITSAVSYNEYTYLRTKDFVYKMKYHHIVSLWNVTGTHPRSTLLKFDTILILAEGNSIFVIDEATQQVQHIKIKFPIKGVSHPVTYVNKLLVYDEKHLDLMNLISSKNIYSFAKFLTFLQETQTQIELVEASYLPDIVAVALDNGTIAFLNLKKDVVVFTFKQKLAPTSLSFSNQQALMATGDANGNVILWDLQNKRILYKFEQEINGCIDSLIFIPGHPLLTCGSSTSNCIKQLRINFDDNKILTLHRERIGNKNALENCVIATNNDLFLNTTNETMYMSFYSQCNNYMLPRVLDSNQSTHIVSHHFNVQVHKDKTLEKTLHLHQKAYHGKISLSGKYYIVSTKSKMVKLGGTSQVQWKIKNIQQIVLYNEHYIYAFTDQQMVVCDFNTETIISRVDVGPCTQIVANLYKSMMGLFNEKRNTIEIWDLQKIVQARIFHVEGREKVLALAFTSDNKYLLSSHAGGSLLIWSIVDNQLYKEYRFESQQNIIWMGFTPDNQFFMSIFSHQKEANIWNNYLGKISSSRDIQHINFSAEVRIVNEDYRKELTLKKQDHSNQQEMLHEDIFDPIPDANDGVPEYSFQDINKWMPLVYYDEIRARNTPDIQNQDFSIPFFLDFKNLTQEKQKIQKQLENQRKEKKQRYNEAKQKNLQNKAHEIMLGEQSTEEEYISQYKLLQKLSIAEIDYQLRKFLLNPFNKIYLLRMIRHVLEAESRHGEKQEIKNIILNRILNLLGTDIFDEEIKKQIHLIVNETEAKTEELKERVNRCIAIVEKQTKQGR